MKFSLFALLFLAFSLSCIQVAKGQELCAICEFVVGEVEQVLDNNATDYEILNALASACSLLMDPTWIQDCKTFIDEEGEVLIEHIVAQDPPAVACAAIDLCNSSSIAKPKPSPIIAAETKAKIGTPKSGDDVICGVCTFVVTDVEKYIENNATESDILNWLENDCNLLGIKSWVATCKGTVATFGPEIIQLVIAKQPADVVCTEIGLCGNSSSSAKAKIAKSLLSPRIHAAKVAEAAKMIAAPAPALKVPGTVNNTLVCEVCEVLVNFTESFIANNKTETEIIAGLNDICAAIPFHDIAQTCSSMVHEYGSIIISYLLNEEPAAVVCSEIDLCSASTKQCHTAGKC